MKKLIYITDARLPTEKANGYQICKMCEAFAKLGIEVKLYHPYREQPENLKNKNVFEYYGIQKNFKVITVLILVDLLFSLIIIDILLSFIVNIASKFIGKPEIL